jgi:1-pyrroline-5-carboxylate dehydrogenase
MSNTIFKVPTPKNTPVLDYAPGSPERTKLQKCIKEMLSDEIEIPLIIGGKSVHTGQMGECRCPHNHQHILARYHKAGPEEIKMAAKAAHEAWIEWSQWDWRTRSAIFLKMSELIAGPFRMILNASTMLVQSKTPHQAEIDAACELIDFYRYNPYFMSQIYAQQPFSAPGTYNYIDYRPLEGFVFAVTPFNFTSIAGNLPTSPVLMGNTVLWKPASSAVYSAYYLMQLFKEAGIPDGVINFIPAPGRIIGDVVLKLPTLSGVHFTGSTGTFNRMWKTIGENMSNYRTYPRIVGETGGKGFVFVHGSANVDAVVANVVRGAFEYQGQKCSAATRLYAPDNLWPKIKEKMIDEIKTIKMGDVTDFSTFMGAIIDEAAFDSIVKYIEYAKNSNEAEILIGGGYDKSKGYFIEPTLVLTTNPKFKLMEEEIFGPVLTIYVYPEKEYEKTLEICDNTSPYALTGCVFAAERKAIETALIKLRHNQGNFYINSKPTGAVVGQQPFGGSRASGTNDKAGSFLNLIRWVSARTVNEILLPVTDYRYPYLRDEK